MAYQLCLVLNTACEAMWTNLGASVSMVSYFGVACAVGFASLPHNIIGTIVAYLPHHWDYLATVILAILFYWHLYDWWQGDQPQEAEIIEEEDEEAIAIFTTIPDTTTDKSSLCCSCTELRG